MRFRIEQRFSHPIGVVEAALADPQFIAEMGSLPRVGRPQLLSRDVDGSNVHLRIRYAFVGHLSSAVRAVVDPARLTWIQDETADWTTHRSQFAILPDNYEQLLRAGGTCVITDDGQGGCRRVAEGEVRVNMPLVGGKVERAIISGLEEHADEEAKLLHVWAAQTGSS